MSRFHLLAAVVTCVLIIIVEIVQNYLYTKLQKGTCQSTNEVISMKQYCNYTHKYGALNCFKLRDFVLMFFKQILTFTLDLKRKNRGKTLESYNLFCGAETKYPGSGFMRHQNDYIIIISTQFLTLQRLCNNIYIYPHKYYLLFLLLNCGME